MLCELFPESPFCLPPDIITLSFKERQFILVLHSSQQKETTVDGVLITVPWEDSYRLLSRRSHYRIPEIAIGPNKKSLCFSWVFLLFSFFVPVFLNLLSFVSHLSVTYFFHGFYLQGTTPSVGFLFVRYVVLVCFFFLERVRSHYKKQGPNQRHVTKKPETSKKHVTNKKQISKKKKY